MGRKWLESYAVESLHLFAAGCFCSGRESEGSECLVIIYLPPTCTTITITQNPSTYLLGTWTLSKSPERFPRDRCYHHHELLASVITDYSDDIEIMDKKREATIGLYRVL